MELNKLVDSFKKPFVKIVRSSKKVYSGRTGIFILVGLLISNIVLAGLLSIIVLKNPESSQYQLAQILQKQTTISEKISSTNIQEKYQEMISQLVELNQKKFNDEEVKNKIETLSEEIYNLRVLNPYYRFKEVKASFIPTGVPDVYGEELGISFDAVQDAINKVRLFGPTYGGEGKKIALTDFTSSELERYKNIGSLIACEYCCGVKTLTREDGTAACGCAHSIMMRGLSAYLIKNHPEFSNEQILEELTSWKITYFPKQTLSAELQKMEEAGESGIKELLEEFPDFLPQMVGGC